MPSKFHARLLSGAALLVLGAPAYAQDPEPALQDVIVVTGTRIDPATESAITPDAAPLEGGDITYLAARTPGGARIGNGELSGQMQYRGLFGERLKSARRWTALCLWRTKPNGPGLPLCSGATGRRCRDRSRGEPGVGWSRPRRGRRCGNQAG